MECVGEGKLLFLSQIAQEAKVEVEPEVVDKVEDKSTSIPVDELVSALRSFRKPSKSETVGTLVATISIFEILGTAL